jgi:hypothetical protein
MPKIGVEPGMLQAVHLFPESRVDYLVARQINHVPLAIGDWADIQLMFFESGGSGETLDEDDADFNVIRKPKFIRYFGETLTSLNDFLSRDRFRQCNKTVS